MRRYTGPGRISPLDERNVVEPREIFFLDGRTLHPRTGEPMNERTLNRRARAWRVESF